MREAGEGLTVVCGGGAYYLYEQNDNFLLTVETVRETKRVLAANNIYSHFGVGMTSLKLVGQYTY